MSLPLELNCLVLGDNPSHVFTVEIIESKNVSALKELIKDKKKHAFKDVDADALDIFRVSFPVDDDLDATLKSFQPCHDPENGVHHLSIPVKRLKGVFVNPIDEHIHVIVLRPPPPSSSESSSFNRSLDLNCIVFGDKPSHVFTVEIIESKNVSALKKAIKDEKKHAFKDVDADALNLWKVDVDLSDDPEGSLSRLELREGVEGVEKLKDMWTDVAEILSHLPRKHLHIVVDPPDTYTLADLVEKIDLGKKAEWDVECLEQKQTTTVESIRNAPVPSSSAKLTFLKNDPNGRPEARPGLPIGLYHPAFTQFQASFDDPSIEVSSEELSLTSQLIFDSTPVYPNERRRFLKLKPHLDQLLKSEFIMVEGTKVKADGVMITQVSNRYIAYSGMWELKNEVGCGGSDPVTQASYSYRKYWGAKDKDEVRSSCCCPSFIIAIAGPWICVLGAIFADETVIELLTDYIWLGAHPLHETRLRRVARLFKCLAVGLQTIDVFYRNLEVARPGQPLAARLFLQICSYPSFAGDIRFHYISKLVMNSHEKAVFKAKTDRNQRLIVIKFTQQYCADAHRVLAKKGLALNLIHVDCIYQSIPMTSSLFGAPLMVVMDFVSGSPSNELFGEAPVSQHVHSRVQVAIKALHERDIVFGDLRRPNIMLTNSNEVKMIDFDWCGKDGEATYPAILNDTGDISWHPDVARGSLMRKEHDLFMLDNLLPAALLTGIVEESEPEL